MARAGQNNKELELCMPFKNSFISAMNSLHLQSLHTALIFLLQKINPSQQSFIVNMTLERLLYLKEIFKI